MLLRPGENADLLHFKNVDLSHDKKTRVARVETALLPRAP